MRKTRLYRSVISFLPATSRAQDNSFMLNQFAGET